MIASLEARAKDLNLTLLNANHFVNQNKKSGKGSMLNGPRLSDGYKGVFFGTYQLLMFTEKDQGKILRVYAESSGITFWVEIWEGIFDGLDIGKWSKERIHKIRSPQRYNPELAWRVEPGSFTVYFVAYGQEGTITDFDISYEIFVE